MVIQCIKVVVLVRAEKSKNSRITSDKSTVIFKELGPNRALRGQNKQGTLSVAVFTAKRSSAATLPAGPAATGDSRVTANRLQRRVESKC